MFSVPEHKSHDLGGLQTCLQYCKNILIPLYKFLKIFSRKGISIFLKIQLCRKSFVLTSVADPESLSQIPDSNFFHPGSRDQKGTGSRIRIATLVLTPALVLQEIIHATLNDHLGGKLYDAQKVSNWSKNIADSVKSQVKTLGYER